MKIPLHYVAGVVLFGLIFSYGMMALTYHPQPVQVQINPYPTIKSIETFKPAEPPTPAITTVPVPTSTGKFDPATAPVIVTTDPATIKNTNTDRSTICSTQKNMQSEFSSSVKTVGILFMVIGVMVLIFVAGGLVVFDREDPPARSSAIHANMGQMSEVVYGAFGISSLAFTTAALVIIAILFVIILTISNSVMTTIPGC